MIPCNVTPPEDVVVYVDSRREPGLGVVILERDLVLVPLSVVAIEHPGQVDAIVKGADGKNHDARVIAIDRESGLALLRVDAPLAVTPLTIAPEGSQNEDSCAVSIPRLPLEKDRPLTWWTYGANQDPSAPFQIKPRFEPDNPDATWWRGAPIIDKNGQIVGVIGSYSQTFASENHRVDADAIARLLTHRSDQDAHSPYASTARSAFNFHFGLDLQTEFTRMGGLWFGGGFNAQVRYRDLAELRVDAAMLLLFPVGNAGGCVEGCAGGLRGVITPSIGPRISLARGASFFNIAVTPSMGVAFGLQDTTGEGSTAFDAAYPNTWIAPAPGLAISAGPIELRGRVRLANHLTHDPTYETVLGVVF